MGRSIAKLGFHRVEVNVSNAGPQIVSVSADLMPEPASENVPINVKLFANEERTPAQHRLDEGGERRCVLSDNGMEVVAHYDIRHQLDLRLQNRISQEFNHPCLCIVVEPVGASLRSRGEVEECAWQVWSRFPRHAR